MVRCKLNCIQLGGESTLVMLEEREEVYRANSKLKHFRNESSAHYIGASYGPIGVSITHRPTSTLFSARFGVFSEPASQTPSPVPAVLPEINSVPKAVKIATVLAWVSMKIATVWRGGGFRPPTAMVNGVGASRMESLDRCKSLGQRRSVRKRKTIHNSVSPASIRERPTRGPSYASEPSIFLNGIPIGLLEKKL